MRFGAPPASAYPGGYVAFWGAVGLLILVLKRNAPKDEDEDDGLPRPPGIG